MEIVQQNENQIQLAQFYDSLDDNTANYLKAKEYELDKLNNSYITQLGKIFKEAQDKLAKNGYGTFGDWIEILGFKADTIYRWINRYDLIIANCDNQNAVETIENMPKSLSYEIAKKSAPPQLVQQVLDGEITNHKDYMTEKAKIKAEYEAELAEKQTEIERLKQDNIAFNRRIGQEKESKDFLQTQLNKTEIELKKAQNAKPEPIIKTEIVHEESPELQKAYYEAQQRADELNERLLRAEEELNKLSKIKEAGFEIKQLTNEITRLKAEQSNAQIESDNNQIIFDTIKKLKNFVATEITPLGTLVIPYNTAPTIQTEINNIVNVLEDLIYAIKIKFKIN